MNDRFDETWDVDGDGDVELDEDVDEEPEEDDPEAELEEGAWVSCPYCGASVELLIDVGGGASQDYVEDCEVCCRPWSVQVSLDGSGGVSVSVTTLDDE